MRNTSKILGLTLAASLASACSSEYQANASKVGEAGFTPTPRSAHAICFDFNGKVIYNQSVNPEEVGLKGQVATFETRSGRKELVKASCNVTYRYYDESEAERVAAIRATQPLVATITNGIDSIILSERFTTAEDSGAVSSDYDGIVELKLEAANGAVLEKVRTTAANVIVTSVKTKPAFTTEPSAP